MLSSLTRFFVFVFIAVFCAPVLAAPDYVATIPCPGPKPDSDPTLNPNEPIVRLKGKADTLEFEVRPANGVNLTISNWKINGDAIFNAEGNMTQAVPDWGVFVSENDMKTLKWTLGGTKDGSFKLTAVLKRSCGGGVGGGGELQDEDLDLWGGDVLSIESLSWEAVDSPLDDNPADMGGGKRIFPDKTTPTDTTARNTVRVKAQLNKPKAGVAVHFRAFDVDDPTANTAPLDDDANGADGDDNRGTGAGGSLAATQVNTVVENGVATATVTFTVSMQPGNNFRVAAALDAANLTPLTTDQVPNGANEQYVPASNAQVEKFNGRLTDLLTVWRKLHVEVDSMGAPTGNTVTGMITDVDADQADNTRSIITTDQTLTVRTLPANQVTPDSPNRFVPGKLRSNGQDFTVIANESGANFRVTVQNINGQTPIAGAFELFDDDMTTDIPDPVLDQMEVKFRPAFIQTVFDGGGNINNNESNLPFGSNFRDGYIDTTLEPIAKSHRQSVSKADFWTTHCYQVFQYVVVGDNDPNTEGAINGISSRRTAFIFYEQMREYGYATNGHHLVHEVGHNFGLADEYSLYGTSTNVTVNDNGTATVTMKMSPQTPVPASAIISPGSLIGMNPDGSFTNDRWSVVSHTSGTTITIVVTTNNGQVPSVNQTYNLRPVDTYTNGVPDYIGIMYHVGQGVFTNANLSRLRSVQFPGNGEIAP